MRVSDLTWKRGNLSEDIYYARINISHEFLLTRNFEHEGDKLSISSGRIKRVMIPNWKTNFINLIELNSGEYVYRHHDYADVENFEYVGYSHDEVLEQLRKGLIRCKYETIKSGKITRDKLASFLVSDNSKLIGVRDFNLYYQKITSLNSKWGLSNDCFPPLKIEETYRKVSGLGVGIVHVQIDAFCEILLPSSHTLLRNKSIEDTTFYCMKDLEGIGSNYSDEIDIWNQWIHERIDDIYNIEMRYLEIINKTLGLL